MFFNSLLLILGKKERLMEQIFLMQLEQTYMNNTRFWKKVTQMVLALLKIPENNVNSYLKSEDKGTLAK